MHWLITDRGDDAARRLVDGETTGGAPHYSRKTPGSRQFTRTGENLVAITSDHLAVWVSFRPAPYWTRQDGRRGVECAVFRNEGPVRSSVLIREAVQLTWAMWCAPGPDGLFTFVNAPRVVRGSNGIAGYCYRRAGWRHVGSSRRGLLIFRAPRPDPVPPLTMWRWHHDRGGVLRRPRLVGWPA